MRRKRSSTHSAAKQPRPARRAPSGAREKLADATACPNCGASYREGRWTWEPALVGSSEQQCPACERIAGRYPAGVLRVEGAFAREHRGDLIGLVRNVEERERAEHPLNRVMSIEENENGFVVETTNGKLAQALGRALHKAYAGQLEHPPTTADKENLVRVRWVRG
jgi:NMD protein affecting ribosome stability and mRNA decay